MGRKVKQMSDVGQNTMQNTLQVSRQRLGTRQVVFSLMLPC